MSESETSLVYIGWRKLSRDAMRYYVMFLKIKMEDWEEEKKKRNGGMERDREESKNEILFMRGKRI